MSGAYLQKNWNEDSGDAYQVPHEFGREEKECAHRKEDFFQPGIASYKVAVDDKDKGNHREKGCHD